jgi:S-adenosyl methyltransferase
VLAHARARLVSARAGATAYIDADLRVPESILDSPRLRDTLDLSRPVALSIIGILHFIPDGDDPVGIVRTLMNALPPGSYLALTHATSDFAADSERIAETYRARGIPTQPRGRAEVERFVTSLELVEPGLQAVHRWRPDDASADGLAGSEISVYGALARKT